MSMNSQSQLAGDADTPVVEYVSKAKAVELLDVSEDTWDRHIRPALLTGEIASFKIGARRTISWRSLIAYLERHHNGAVGGLS